MGGKSAMVRRRHEVLMECIRIGQSIGVKGHNVLASEFIGAVRKAADTQAARMEVLEREYATLSRMISNLEQLHAQQEMQGVQDSVCSNEANAGRVLDGMCCGVGKAET